MARQKVKEYYHPSELTPELLAGLVDETDYRPRAILQYLEPIAHDTEQIQMDILIQQVDRFANIVGFADSSIKTEGVKTQTKFVNPFHVKNYTGFKSTDSKGLTRTGDGWMVSAAGVRQSTMTLEERRMNLLHWSVLAMVNDRQFSYQDGDVLLTVPFTSEIGQLTSPANPLNNASADIFEYILSMKNEYLLETSQKPNLVFMNALTGGKFIQIAEVNAAFTAQQGNNRADDADNMFDAFRWNGMTWVILHEEYPDLDGTLKSPIDDHRMVVTVDNVVDPDPDVAGAPFKMHRAANNLNAEDSSRPYYDMFEVSNDPAEWGHRLYDNWIPGVAKRNTVMHWDDATEA